MTGNYRSNRLVDKVLKMVFVQISTSNDMNETSSVYLYDVWRNIQGRSSFFKMLKASRLQDLGLRREGTLHFVEILISLRHCIMNFLGLK